MTVDAQAARELAERLYAPATGGNTRPLRTEAADALVALAARLEAAESREAFLTEQLDRQTENAGMYLARLEAAETALRAALAHADAQGLTDATYWVRDVRAALDAGRGEHEEPPA